MRHTLHLFIGDRLQDMAVAVKRYVTQYSEANASHYFHVVSWTKGESCWQASDVIDTNAESSTFISGLEDQYQVGLSEPEEISSKEIGIYYFNKRADVVNIDDNVDSSHFNLCVYLPLYDESLWAEVKNILSYIGKSQAKYIVDIVGLAEDLEGLFVGRDKDEIKKVQENNLIHRQKVASVSEAIVGERREHPNRIHRFMILSNRNSKGISLNFDEDSLVRVLGEYALVNIENYDAFYPQAEDHNQFDITAFGLSILNFDKFYFKHYLLRRSYIYILERENVAMGKVDVNLASVVAQKLLRGNEKLFSSFYDEEVKPLLREGKPHEDIIATIVPKLDSQISQLTERLVSVTRGADSLRNYVTDGSVQGELSLPEKEAVMAQVLGQDDSLLDGAQYNKEQLVIDDLVAEPLQFFIDHNNRMVKMEEDKSTGTKTFTPAVLHDPHDESGHVYLPLPELKRLRFEMRQSSAYIRAKDEELKTLESGIQLEINSEKRLTEQGFQFGGNVYKLLGDEVEERLFEEEFVPQRKPLRDIDLRQHFSPIRSQGQIGSCTVFAVTAIYEYLLRRSKAENPDMSEHFVYYNVCKKDADGNPIDDGSSIYDVVKSMSDLGICHESDCPYDGTLSRPTEEAYAEAKNHIIKQAQNVKIDHQHITSALTEGYPVTISLALYDSFSPDKNGFIYRPTDEEIKEGKPGYHAMVIVGYSEDSRVYIVRNSWGTDFGDKGYCYIPFSYIEDSALNRGCSIVKEISDKVSIDAGPSAQVLSFNQTDSAIRYAIIHILRDEEQAKLNAYASKYAKLSHEYQELVEELSNPTKRNDILTAATANLEEANVRLKTRYGELLNQFGQEERAQKSLHRLSLIKLGAGVLVIPVVIGLVYYWVGLFNPWTLLLFAFGVILWFYLFNRYRNQELDTKREHELQLGAILKQQRDNEAELNDLHLRFHVAGMMIDRLEQKMHHNMLSKYHTLKSYINNLATWLTEEKTKLEEMESVVKNPLVPIISNEALDRYFDSHKEELTKDIHLYSLLDEYAVDDDVICAFKNGIKRILVEQMDKPLEKFTVYDYLSQTIKYPFLDNSIQSIKTVLETLDKKSRCFLPVCGQASVSESLRYIQLFTSNDTQRTEWRQIYPKYFQSLPTALDAQSRFKLVVIQKDNYMKEDVKIFQTDDASSDVK